MKTLALIGCFLPLLVCSAKPFKTSEEKIPAEVKRATAKQIERHLGSRDDFKGVPLLDEGIDWNDYRNWPREFRFRGKTYVLETHLLDFNERLHRDGNAPRGHVLLGYRIEDDEPRDPPLSPAAMWSADRTLKMKSLNTSHLVFSYEFYPTGELLGFARTDAETKNDLTEYFDKTGRKRGTVTDALNPHPRCEWDGEKVDCYTCIKNKDAMCFGAFVRPFKTAEEKIPKRGGIVPMTPDNPEGLVWGGRSVSSKTWEAERLNLWWDGGGNLEDW